MSNTNALFKNHSVSRITFFYFPEQHKLPIKLLAPNHRHYAVAVAVAVPSLLLALSAVLTVAAVQHLQSEQIGFVLSISWCQGELVLVTSQQGMMWQI